MVNEEEKYGKLTHLQVIQPDLTLGLLARCIFGLEDDGVSAIIASLKDEASSTSLAYRPLAH